MSYSAPVSRSKKLKDPSLWLLLIVNLSIIFYTDITNIDSVNIVLIFAAQSIIIGFFTFVRLCKISKFDSDLIGFPIPYPLFFVIHYGIFTVAYISFIFGVVNIENIDVIHIGAGVLLFFFTHLFSFLFNSTDVHKSSGILESFKPYPRIVPMHLMIFIASLELFYASTIFLLLKTAIDVAAHYIKHNAIYKTDPVASSSNNNVLLLNSSSFNMRNFNIEKLLNDVSSSNNYDNRETPHESVDILNTDGKKNDTSNSVTTYTIINEKSKL